MSDRLQVTIDGGVADVRLNRPDKMNALDRDMFEALAETAAQLAADPGLRCVVLSGEGRAFCAGLDFSSFSGMADGSRSQRQGSITDTPDDRITHDGQQAVYGWTEMPVPVIAAVHGHALGGGIQLALGPTSGSSTPRPRCRCWRSGGADPRHDRNPVADQPRGPRRGQGAHVHRSDGDRDRGRRTRLATHLSEDPRTHALELAAEIAEKSPHAIRAAKRLFNAAPKVSVADGFRQEREEIGALIGSPNQVEQVKAFFEKRRPSFVDPES